MAWQNGKFIPEEAIGQQYKFADDLSNQKWAPTWAGVLAGGLAGIGSGIHRNSAQNALQGNQSLMAQTLKGLGDAKTLEEAQGTLLSSEVPSLQKSGADSRLKSLSDDPNKEYRVRAAQWKQMGYTPETAGYKEFVLTGRLPGTGDGSDKFGLNPIYGVDAEGNPVVMQLNTGGGAAPVRMPEGVTVSKTPIRMDAGTHFVLLDPITRQQIGMVPKDVAGKKAQEEIGSASGKAKVALPTVMNASERILATIKSIEDDPDLEKVTGFVGGRLPKGLHTEAMAKTQSKLDQLQGQTFLQAYNDLRGAGQITEREGQAAQNAYNRLTTQTMGTEEYKTALREFKDEVLKLVEIAKQKAGVDSDTGADDGWTDVGGVRIREKK